MCADAHHQGRVARSITGPSTGEAIWGIVGSLLDSDTNPASVRGRQVIPGIASPACAHREPIVDSPGPLG